MPTRLASCSCGQLTAQASGDPVRNSICHCLACQRRTGSPFAPVSVYEERMHSWIVPPPDAEHIP